jgi:hypothetical protein
MTIYSQERAVALMQDVTPLRQHNDGSAWVDGKRYRYHLIPGASAYVFTKDNTLLGTACIEFSGWLPYADKMIAEYILIKNNEALYLKIAKLSFGRPKFRDFVLAASITGVCGGAIYMLIQLFIVLVTK